MVTEEIRAHPATPAIYAIAVGFWIWLIWYMLHQFLKVKADSVIVDVRKDVRMLQTMQGKNSGTVVELVQRNGNLYLQFDGLESKITGLDSKVQGLSIEVGALRAEHIKLASNLNTVRPIKPDGRVAALETTTKTLIATTEELKTNVEHLLSLDVVKKSGDIRDIRAGMANLSKRVSDVTSQVTNPQSSELRAMINDINTEFGAFRRETENTITSGPTQHTSGNGAMHSDEAELMSAQGKIEELCLQVSILSSQVSTLLSDVTQLGEQTNSMKSEVDQVVTRVNGLDTALTNCNTKVGAVQATLNAKAEKAQADVDRVRIKLDAQAYHVSHLVPSLKQLEMKVDAKNGMNDYNIQNLRTDLDSAGRTVAGMGEKLGNLGLAVGQLSAKLSGITPNTAHASKEDNSINVEMDTLKTQVEALRQSWRQLTENRVQALMDAGIRSDLMLYILAIEGINKNAVDKGLVSAGFFAKVQESIEGANMDGNILAQLIDLGFVEKCGVQDGVFAKGTVANGDHSS